MTEVIGFQIVAKDQKYAVIPEDFWSFQVFPEKDVDRWIKHHGKHKWEKAPIHKGDIEEPTFSTIYS